MNRKCEKARCAFYKITCTGEGTVTCTGWYGSRHQLSKEEFDKRMSEVDRYTEEQKRAIYDRETSRR